MGRSTSWTSFATGQNAQKGSRCSNEALPTTALAHLADTHLQRMHGRETDPSRAGRNAVTLLQGARSALRLLGASDKRKLAVVTSIQAATSLLDLAGVLLLGTVGALAVTTVQGSEPPPAV